MPENDNPNGTPPARETDSRSKRIECDFCHCIVAPDGGILKTSAEAKAFQKLEADRDDWKAKYDALKADVDEKERKRVADLNDHPPADAKKFLVKV